MLCVYFKHLENHITAQINSKLDRHRMFMCVQSGFTRYTSVSEEDSRDAYDVAGPKSLSTVSTTKYEQLAEKYKSEFEEKKPNCSPEC